MLSLHCRSSPMTAPKIRFFEDAVLKAAPFVVDEANHRSNIVYRISSGKGSVKFLRVRYIKRIEPSILNLCNFLVFVDESMVFLCRLLDACGSCL